jgi:hypothetical protein
MPPTCLTILAPLRRGEETALGGILRAIGDDIKGKRLAAGERPHIDFRRCPRTHFARFAILNDPDRGAGCTRLLFASVYDGDLDGHLAELVAATSDMQAIWGGCEGYGGTADFGAFVRQHELEPAGFYIAFRDETAASIQRALGDDRRPAQQWLVSWLTRAPRRSSARCRYWPTSCAPSRGSGSWRSIATPARSSRASTGSRCFARSTG